MSNENKENLPFSEQEKEEHIYENRPITNVASGGKSTTQKTPPNLPQTPLPPKTIYEKPHYVNLPTKEQQPVLSTPPTNKSHNPFDDMTDEAFALEAKRLQDISDPISTVQEISSPQNIDQSKPITPDESSVKNTTQNLIPSTPSQPPSHQYSTLAASILENPQSSPSNESNPPTLTSPYASDEENIDPIHKEIDDLIAELKSLVGESTIPSSTPQTQPSSEPLEEPLLPKDENHYEDIDNIQAKVAALNNSTATSQNKPSSEGQNISNTQPTYARVLPRSNPLPTDVSTLTSPPSPESPPLQPRSYSESIKQQLLQDQISSPTTSDEDDHYQTIEDVGAQLKKFNSSASVSSARVSVDDIRNTFQEEQDSLTSPQPKFNPDGAIAQLLKEDPKKIAIKIDRNMGRAHLEKISSLLDFLKENKDAGVSKEVRARMEKFGLVLKKRIGGSATTLGKIKQKVKDGRRFFIYALKNLNKPKIKDKQLIAACNEATELLSAAILHKHRPVKARQHSSDAHSL